MPRLGNSYKSIGLLFTIALLAGAQEVRPGIVNCSEGQVEIGTQPVLPEMVGSTYIGAGDTLQTAEGRAELLLTPGVYVRIGVNSQFKVTEITPVNISMELVRGEAIVEVDQVQKDRKLTLTNKGAEAEFVHPGLFGFSTKASTITVYKGALHVDDDRHTVHLHTGEQVLLNDGLKSHKFDFNETDSLYAWSAQRADYACRVSEWTGAGLQALSGLPKYTDGWYWNPWYKSWAYIPVKGYVLTPFGYGLYAPQQPHDVRPVFADFRN